MVEKTITDTGVTAADVVRKVYAAFNSCDPARIATMAAECFADDIVVREPESLPWGGVYEGLDIVTAMTVGISSPESPIVAAQIVVQQLITAEPEPDGTAQVVAVVSFPWRGPLQVIPMRALEWFTVRAGKVAEIQVFLWDTAAAIAALSGAEN
jgi:ketosteroid isomerase-like protein